MKKVLTTCGYCGCGCNLYLTVEGGHVTGVLPKPDHPVSQGMLCSKGWQGHGFVRHPDRLDQPLIRHEDGTLRPASWNEAYRAIAEQFRSLTRVHGPVGLNIGAKSPAEIAVSILGQIIEVRARRLEALAAPKVAAA